MNYKPEKQQRKIIGILCMFILCMTLGVNVHAVEKETYELDDIGLSIELPANFLTVTQDTEDSYIEKYFTITPKELKDEIASRPVEEKSEEITTEAIVEQNTVDQSSTVEETIADAESIYAAIKPADGTQSL